MASISYTVEAHWEPSASSRIVFDSTAYGDGDYFAEPLVVDWASGVVAEIANVQSIKIVRGRDNNLASLAMGECQIEVEDTAGLYNPSNESSALYGLVRPMQWVRVRAQVSGYSEQTIFEGLIRNVDFKRNPDRGVAVFTCGDLFLQLSRTIPVFPNVGRDTTTGEVITDLLSASSLDALPNSISVGDDIPSPGVNNPDGGSTALSVLQSLMEIERGDLYMAKDGEFTFAERAERATKANYADFQDISTGATATTDLERVRNKATVTRETLTGDYTSEWFNADSIADYGQQDFGDISSAIIYDQNQALALAQWLVFTQSNPFVPFRALDLSPTSLDAATAEKAVHVEISDRVTVQNSILGLSQTAYYVEGISHDISAEEHKVRLALVPKLIDALILDDADRGRLGYNALAY
jgi:hypothetical protein